MRPIRKRILMLVRAAKAQNLLPVVTMTGGTDADEIYEELRERGRIPAEVSREFSLREFSAVPFYDTTLKFVQTSQPFLGVFVRGLSLKEKNAAKK